MSEIGDQEKIDIITYDEDLKTFISNALSPTEVASVEINEKDKKATVKVAEDQLSIAIGKGGQNVRLASKLVGYDIDIESAGEIVSSAKAEEEPKKPKTRKNIEDSLLEAIDETVEGEEKAEEVAKEVETEAEEETVKEVAEEALEETVKEEADDTEESDSDEVVEELAEEAAEEVIEEEIAKETQEEVAEDIKEEVEEAEEVATEERLRPRKN